jgi:hypothetical protein
MVATVDVGLVVPTAFSFLVIEAVFVLLHLFWLKWAFVQGNFQIYPGMLPTVDVVCLAVTTAFSFSVIAAVLVLPPLFRVKRTAVHLILRMVDVDVVSLAVPIAFSFLVIEAVLALLPPFWMKRVVALKLTDHFC